MRALRLTRPCDICGRSLHAREFLRELFSFHHDTYPMRTVTGQQTEARVRWLCDRCRDRAGRRRAKT